MDHTCYRCGEPVADGVAFCESCRAPQIKVAVATENSPATPPLRPGTPDELQPPARPADFGYPAPPPRTYSSAPPPFSWRDAMPGAMLAGGVAGLAWMLPPLGYLLWPLTAGVLGVVLYHRRRPDAFVSSGAGARIGAVTGLFGFLIFALLLAISLIGAGRAKFRESLDQAFQQALARNPDPKAQEIMQSFMTPTGIAIMFALVAVVILVFLVGMSSLGGLLGAKLMNRKGPENRG